MGPILRFAFQGRKILKGVWRRQGGTAASGCCMVNATASLNFNDYFCPFPDFPQAL
jgi:hypothetical protein